MFEGGVILFPPRWFSDGDSPTILRPNCNLEASNGIPSMMYVMNDVETFCETTTRLALLLYDKDFTNCSSW